MLCASVAVTLLAARALAGKPDYGYGGYGYGHEKPTHTSSSPASHSSTYQGTGPYAAGVYVNYTSVPGYFLQDDLTTNASTFDYTAVNFGLINRTYALDWWYFERYLTQWQRFEWEVARLNLFAPRNVDYKVLFLGRHGQGFHNAAESYYGTPAWNCYWAEVLGNGTSSWVDARLTSVGINQALIANNFWAHEIAVQKIRTPDSFYTSPLYRCLATANLTFTGLPLGRNGGNPTFKPTVKELLREGISIHTCDHRSNRSSIHANFPSYSIERGFVEHDPLWNGVTAESGSAQDYRSRLVLDDVFYTDRRSTFISFTSHSGEISSLLRVLGHRAFSLNTGAVIPVLVRAETIKPQSSTTTAWAPDPHCTVPPVTSVAGTGCVCPASATPVTTPLVSTPLP